MDKLTEDQISKLLLDPACPYAMYWEEFRSEAAQKRLPRRGVNRRPRNRPIPVEALKRFARERYGEVHDLEEKLDAFVEGIGGERLGMIDPWSAPRRAIRRLLGKMNPTGDVYEIPESFFEKHGEQRAVRR